MQPLVQASRGHKPLTGAPTRLRAALQTCCVLNGTVLCLSGMNLNDECGPRVKYIKRSSGGLSLKRECVRLSMPCAFTFGRGVINELCEDHKESGLV